MNSSINLFATANAALHLEYQYYFGLLSRDEFIRKLGRLYAGYLTERYGFRASIALWQEAAR